VVTVIEKARKQLSDAAALKKTTKVLFSVALINYLFFFVVVAIVGGFEYRVREWHISCQSLSGPSWISLYICVIGIVISWKYFSEKAAYLCIKSVEWSKKDKKISFAILCFISVAVFASVSLPNHFQLRTNAYDLGIHASILRNILAGKGFFDTVHGYNYLGDHFSPFIALTAPLLFLWGNSAILLIFQAVLLALAGAGVFKLAKFQTPLFPFLFFLLFIFSPYVQRINGFDYHPVSISIPLVIWGLYFLEENKNIPFLLLIFASFLVKETLSLSAVGLSFFLILSKDKRKIGFILLSVSILFFVVVNALLIPAFQNPELKGKMLGYYWKSRYGNLGNSPIEAVYNLAASPLAWLTLGKVKILLRLLGFSGFLVLFAGKRFIPLLIPIAWCLLSGYRHQWAFDGQYSAELVPYYFYASIFGLSSVLSMLRKKFNFSAFNAEGCAFICMFLLLVASLISFPLKTMGFGKTKNIYNLVNKIPPESSVLTQNSIHPHVSMQNVFILMTKKLAFYSTYNPEYSNNMDIKYLLVDPTADSWPFPDSPSMGQNILKIVENGDYGLLEQRGTAFLFKKGYSKKKNIELTNLMKRSEQNEN